MSNEASVTGTEKKKPGPKKGNRTKEVPMDAVLVGRDKKPIRPEEVYRLAAMGCKNSEISDWLGIDDSTLQYNFKQELIKGREALKQSLRQAQIQLALSGNAVMLIWLGRNILGQSDQGTSDDTNKVLPWEE